MSAHTFAIVYMIALILVPIVAVGCLIYVKYPGKWPWEKKR